LIQELLERVLFVGLATLDVFQLAFATLKATAISFDLTFSERLFLIPEIESFFKFNLS